MSKGYLIGGVHASPEIPWWGPDLPGMYPRPEHYPRLSEREYERRYKMLRDAMRKEELEALLILGRAAMSWVSGYLENTAEPGVVFFPLDGDPTLFIGHGHQTPGARALSAITDIRECMPKGLCDESVKQGIRELRLEKAKIGIAGWNFRARTPEHIISHAFYQHLLEEFPDASFKFLPELITSLACVHSPEELRFIEKAAELCDLAMKAVIEKIKPGMRECEIWGIMRYALAREGGSEQFILLAGCPQTARPAARFGARWPSLRTIQPGDVIINEYGCRYGGYCAQTGKPLSLGEPTKEWKDLYDVGYEMYLKMADQLRPGKTLAEAAKVGDQILKEAGIYCNSVVHGIGIYNEYVNLTEPLKPGMTFVVEPMPYSKDYNIGLFLGDTFAVTEDSPKKLNKLPQQFIIV